MKAKRPDLARGGVTKRLTWLGPICVPPNEAGLSTAATFCTSSTLAGPYPVWASQDHVTVSSNFVLREWNGWLQRKIDTQVHVEASIEHPVRLPFRRLRH